MDSFLRPRPSERRKSKSAPAVLVALVTVYLVGCRSAAVIEGTASGAEPLAPAGEIYRIDPAASEIHILVYRAGPLARLGHNHVVAVQDLEGAVQLSPDREASSFELLLAADRLAVDLPLLRQRYGEAFTSLPTEADIAGTRENMLGPSLLDAAAYPYIRVAGMLGAGTDGDTVSVEIALKDTVLRRTVPIVLRIDAESIRAQGAIEIEHAELGLTPFSVMLGALRVAPTMEIRFSLTARRAPGS